MTDAKLAATRVDDDVRVDGSDLLGDIEFLVARVRAIGSQHAREALRPLGLPVRGFAVLSLACGAVSPTQRDIAEFLQLDPSQVVAVIDMLESAGYVRRAQSPRDRRVNIVEATDLGIETYTKARDAVTAAREESLHKLSPEERETLTRLLLKVAF
ncbi:MarR family transcriptional regulator [Salinibacterium sp. SYSU T00001]|uniref:MarR family winged helix-turn-helix transcriptional regulator n=1 Tax=Homoserinimonas sedimenticola TaxID=2986805 RepID=UPI002235F727|nr:MarR family transcriptional regulator [Salinibacterium sedimenticola]MCW4384878.1 MarR family transcriptional regulator [Salinibacterium sedimenticola]